MSEEKKTLQEVFASHADFNGDKQPRYALMCRVVADDQSLVAGFEDLNDNMWQMPNLVTAAVTHLLRTTAQGHPLAEYLPTLGGERAPDEAMRELYAEFLRVHHDAVADVCRGGGTRWNDPMVVAMLWPAFTYAAHRDPRPLALVELGSAAGLTIQPDRYGYDFGGHVVGGDRSLVLDVTLRGARPDHLDDRPTIASRVAIERDPLDVADPATVAWLRASIRPDAADHLARLDAGIAEARGVHVDWRVGDLIDELPGALRDIPADQLPVVYGSAVLCCLHERRPRFLEILTESGRDLVWISREGSKNALALVSDAAGDYEKSDTLITAVTFRAGEPVSAVVLGRADPYGEWLDWGPKDVPLRKPVAAT